MEAVLPPFTNCFSLPPLLLLVEEDDAVLSLPPFSFAPFTQALPSTVFSLLAPTRFSSADIRDSDHALGCGWMGWMDG